MDNQPIPTQPKNNPYIPIAIIIAGMIIGGSVIYSSVGNRPVNNNVAVEQEAQPTGSPDEMRPVSSDDHIRGDANAPVKIVEFSDTECPFCKSFHPTMKRVMSEYGASGKVAWVYRHFPLSIHPKAQKEAEATECAAEQGGNDKFWAYIDRIYEITPANNRLDESELPKIAQYVGLNVQQFNVCLESGKYSERVANDTQDAINSGGQGTPWTIIVAQNGKKFTVNGAQPYAALKQVIDLALQEK